MKKFFMICAFIWLSSVASAIDQSGTFRFTGLNLDGTIAIDEQLTSTLVFRDGRTGVAKFVATTSPTATITYSDSSTGTITRVASDQSTGTLTFSGATGTYTVTTDSAPVTPDTSYVKTIEDKNAVIISWKAASNGAKTGPVNLYGQIMGIQMFNGDVEPTTLYDFTIADESGFDIIGGQGANCTTGTLYRVPTVTFDSVKYLFSANGSYTFSISNAGALAEGRIKVYLKKD